MASPSQAEIGDRDAALVTSGFWPLIGGRGILHVFSARAHTHVDHDRNRGSVRTAELVIACGFLFQRLAVRGVGTDLLQERRLFGFLAMARSVVVHFLGLRVLTVVRWFPGVISWRGRQRDHADRRLALLAVAVLRAVRSQPGASPGGLAAGRAYKQDVGDRNRHLLREPAALQVLLAALDVPVDAVSPRP
jgi:hypothetical protein